MFNQRWVVPPQKYYLDKYTTEVTKVIVLN